MSERMETHVFEELAHTYEATPKDLDITSQALKYCRAHPFLDSPPSITVLYDSSGIWAFIPEEIGTVTKEVYYLPHFQLVRIPHTEETQSTWNNRIMNQKRGFPGATGWDDTTMEGGPVWKMITHPENWAYPDPNKADKDLTRILRIPSIALPAPMILTHTHGCPDIYTYMINYIRHEQDVHLTDMIGLPWVWDGKNMEFRSGKLLGTKGDYENTLHRLLGSPPAPLPDMIQAMHNYHQNDPSEAPFTQEYLGELLAYIADIWQAHESSEFAPSEWLHQYYENKYSGMMSLHENRIISRYPFMHRNYYAYELAQAIVSAQGYDRLKVLRAMHDIRSLMVGSEKARNMFLKKDLEEMGL